MLSAFIAQDTTVVHPDGSRLTFSSLLSQPGARSMPTSALHEKQKNTKSLPGATVAIRVEFMPLPHRLTESLLPFPVNLFCSIDRFYRLFLDGKKAAKGRTLEDYCATDPHKLRKKFRNTGESSLGGVIFLKRILCIFVWEEMRIKSDRWLFFSKPPFEIFCMSAIKPQW